MLDKELKEKVLKEIVYELTSFIDLYILDYLQENVDYDWVSFFIYKKVIEWQYLVSGEKINLQKFIKRNHKKQKILKDVDNETAKKTMIKVFLNELGDFFKSEKLLNLIEIERKSNEIEFDKKGDN